MAFCDKCKTLVFPKAGSYKCAKCGHEGTVASQKITIAREEREVLMITPEDEAKLEVMPTMRAECVKCGNMEAYYRTQQTRKSDEPETAFLRCTKCGHRWRKY